MLRAGETIDVSEESASSETAVITLRCRRPRTSFTIKSREIFEQLTKEHVWAGVHEIPELVALQTLRAKETTINDELNRLNLDLEQAELHRKRAVVDLDGEELAARLAKLDAEKRDLGARIDACKAGKASFGKELAEAVETARKAIQAHIAKTFASVQEEVKARHAATIKTIQEALPLLELLDEAVIANAVRGMVFNAGAASRFDGKIEQLLAAPAKG
jgi:hypothetical protein